MEDKIDKREFPGWLFETIGATLLFILLFVCSPARAGDNANSSISDLVGTYYWGDGLGFNMTLNIEADGRFSFKWTGCLGTYAQSQGTATCENGTVALKPETKSKDLPSVLLPIRWGERLYLIEQDKLLDFCNAINQSEEPRKDIHGNVYIRVGDEHKPVSCAPALPGEWSSFLLPEPVKGSILKMIGPYEAEVNLGTKNGLKKGMVLYAWGAKDTDFTSVRVTRTTLDSCTVACDSIETIPKNDRKMFCYMAQGQTVTSRFGDQPSYILLMDASLLRLYRRAH
jgi:hypothetical protein